MKKIHGYVTSDTLKIIALIAMTMEHAGTILSGGVHPLVLLGRIAYPIFAFLIMYHLYQTRCFVKYIKRLFFFGVLSTALFIPLNLTDHHIFFSFLIPVLYLYFTQRITQTSWGRACKHLGQGLAFVACLLVSVPLNYSFFGFLYMVVLYHTFKQRTMTGMILCVILGAALNPLNIDYAIISGGITALLLALSLQDKKLLHGPHKWFFYLYYPLHLVVLKAISFF